MTEHETTLDVVPTITTTGRKDAIAPEIELVDPQTLEERAADDA